MYDWHENDWTYRLCYGMKRLFPHARIHYTAEDGLQWNTKFLPKVLDVDQKLADCFLLRGAPDIVINSNKLISTANPEVAEEESSGDETALIENLHQPTKLKSYRTDLLEKVDEVFAGLHLLLVSKLIHRISKQKSGVPNEWASH